MAEQFGWDKAFQGFILSAFFAGYASTQILGGQLADRFGGKSVLTMGVALWSLFTCLTPYAAARGTASLLAVRVLLGIGEGVAFPSIHSLIARNVPLSQQSTTVGIVTAASYAGTALAFGLSPLIVDKYGWQWVFYSFGALALMWIPLWLPAYVVNTLPPSETGVLGNSDVQGPGPSAGEQGSPSEVQQSDDALEGRAAGTAKQAIVGLGALAKRKEVLAICIAQYTQSWGMYGLLNWLPTFFSEQYGVTVADLGNYTLLPYVVQGGIGLLSGVLADKLLAQGLGVRRVRVGLQVVGMLGPAACLLLAVSPYVDPSANTASGIITVGLGLSALTLGGVSASHLDVAPRHAGVVFGAGNTAATLAGLASVPATGLLLQGTGSWPLVFGVTAAHYVVGAVLWAAWAGDSQLPEDGGQLHDS